MIKWFKDVDNVLRGEGTRLENLSEGQLATSSRGLVGVIVLLGAAYGICMGSYAVVNATAGSLLQMLASAVKVPALFLLTLAVTFPSLYVFNALVGSRLSLLSVLRLLVAGMAVMLAVLAGFGTIVAFFSFTTESYAFIVLLNVAVFAVAGFLGLAFLLQTLQRLTDIGRPESLLTPPPQRLPESDPPGSVPREHESEEGQVVWQAESSSPPPPGSQPPRPAVGIPAGRITRAGLAFVLRPWCPGPAA